MRKNLITNIASVIRSKNAGPFELTIDIIFKKEKDYLEVKKNRLITKKLIADTYGISPDNIINIVYFDPAWAVKIAMIRSVSSGAIGDTDVYGAQQHAPLLELKIPLKGN